MPGDAEMLDTGRIYNGILKLELMCRCDVGQSMPILPAQSCHFNPTPLPDTEIYQDRNSIRH